MVGLLRSRSLWIAVLAVAALGVTVLVLLWPEGSVGEGAADPVPTPTTQQPTQPADRCRESASQPFTPHRISVEQVIRDAEVRALPRDANNVPGTPPVSDKAVFAWDRGGIRPGAARGNVLLNAHTWPDGSAIGNAMLRELDVGDRIVVRGASKLLCYDVTERLEVRAEDGYVPYYATDGPPQLAIVVCSGERSGPGDWSHRTLWFARPVA